MEREDHQSYRRLHMTGKPGKNSLYVTTVIPGAMLLSSLGGGRGQVCMCRDCSGGGGGDSYCYNLRILELRSIPRENSILKS